MKSKFQPLFYWTSFKNSYCDRCNYRSCKFQSLFYWTSFKNNATFHFSLFPSLVSILVLLDFIQKRGELTEREKAIAASFNPCFIGLHSKTARVFLSFLSQILFQSLFYWTSFKNAKLLS